MNPDLLADSSALKRYYRFHSRIYDLTRWSFLFGRNAMIDRLAQTATPRTILEVGCGTGKNLSLLAKRFRAATLTGVDLSTDMLDIATEKLSGYQKRIELLEQRYDAPLCNDLGNTQQYDLVLFSYALSMFNPGWELALAAAEQQLSENGRIAVVDFHYSRLKSFRHWMQFNHVVMEQQLLPALNAMLTAEVRETRAAYAGLWQYFLFIGKKK